MKVYMKILILFCLLFFIFIELKIIITPKYEKPKPSDVIIVLGAHLWGDQPSPTLRYRLEKAVTLYQEGFGKYIIVSGAKGDDEVISEAEAMKNYLIEQGIPSENILLENNSYSTFQNIKYSKEIMEKEGFHKAIVVTNTFHLYRSLQIGKHMNISISGAAAKMYPSIPLKIKYYIREFFAVTKFLITGV